MFVNFALIILNNIRLLYWIFSIVNIILMLCSTYDLFAGHVLLFDSDTDSITSQDWASRPVEIMGRRSLDEFGDRSIPELDGRPIHELEGNTHQRTYNAYDPNYVQTSQGWRTELPTSHSTSHDGYHHSGHGRVDRIPNPSHYPPSAPSATTRDSYPLGEISSRGTRHSTLLGEIEPTKSDLNHNGIYSGSSNSGAIVYTKDYRSNVSLFSVIKDKFIQGYKHYDRKLEKKSYTSSGKMTYSSANRKERLNKWKRLKLSAKNRL